MWHSSKCTSRCQASTPSRRHGTGSKYSRVSFVDQDGLTRLIDTRETVWLLTWPMTYGLHHLPRPRTSTKSWFG
jgi:hypothetical protein